MYLTHVGICGMRYMMRFTWYKFCRVLSLLYSQYLPVSPHV